MINFVAERILFHNPTCRDAIYVLDYQFNKKAIMDFNIII
jgi:hypothetical protein